MPQTPVDLSASGLADARSVTARLSAPAMVEAAVRRGEVHVTDAGALVAMTGERTGRSPKDRYIVRDATTDAVVHWGPVNQPTDAATFDRLRNQVTDHLRGRDLFVTDGEACADPAHRLRIRVVAEKAWHALFAQHLFRRPNAADLAAYRPDWHVLVAPECAPGGDPAAAFIGLDFSRRMVVIAGTHYAGEIKKSVFSILNFVLPLREVFSMHCAANVGAAGDVALFFGLSGTGKTTLSADPTRRLIGDDEHGWAADGVFNIEGGCYAKTIKLSRDGEPQIWDAIRFSTVLENVVVDPKTRIPNFNDGSLTENTRAAYPLEFIPSADPTGRGGHPQNIFFLTCDAFGVLPPLAKLTPEQAMYHFLSGYTAKVAGTEVGVTDPTPTFSTCFGAPFMPLPPVRYAEMLRQKMQRHGCPVWLVNTGWTAGPYGVGKRMKLAHTRAMLRAALTGALGGVAFTPDPVFGLLVPAACPDVPPEVLTPRRTWAEPAAYDAQARKLASLFREKFAAFAGQVSDAVKRAGPRE